MDAKVEAAIGEYFSDSSVSQEVTWNRLQEIIQHCSELQETLDREEED